MGAANSDSPIKMVTGSIESNSEIAIPGSFVLLPFLNKFEEPIDCL